METDISQTNSEDVSSQIDNATSEVVSNTENGSQQNVDNAQAETKSVATQPKSGSPNHAAAVRRIQNTNRQLRHEVSKLAKEIQRLQQSAKPEDHAVADRLLDRAETYQTIVHNGERESWEQQVAETYGNQAQQYIDLFDKYAQHVNANEPQVSDYIGTPYGMLLLGEWAKRMEVPQYRMEWLQMPQHRKSAVLARFYDEIEKIATNGSGASAHVSHQTKQAAVPAVSGGAKSGTLVSDFGSYVDDAFKAFGVK